MGDGDGRGQGKNVVKELNTFEEIITMKSITLYNKYTLTTFFKSRVNCGL